MPRVQARTKSAVSVKPKSQMAAPPVAGSGTKAESIIALLKAKRGATLAEIMRTTGWQEHSVRGFLAGALKKRHGLVTVSEKPNDGPRRYRLR